MADGTAKAEAEINAVVISVCNMFSWGAAA